MGVRLNVVTVLLSIAVGACGAKSSGDAKSAEKEKDPWAGYQGTYASGGGSKASADPAPAASAQTTQASTSTPAAAPEKTKGPAKPGKKKKPPAGTN